MNKEPRIYDSRWGKARQAFLREHPLCILCQALGRIEVATVVDHITPHRLKDALITGNPADISRAQKLFWDRGNWQGLCKPHHDSTKQRMEKSGRMTGCDADGIPLDPDSHWNRGRGG